MLELNQLRKDLEAMENSILFALSERSRFMLNNNIYMPGATGIPGLSLFGFMLRATEELHAKLGNYLSAEDVPFSNNLPKPIIKKELVAINLKPTCINLNQEVMLIYKNLIPKLCRKGDDGCYVLTATLDINALQLISRRVHYGFLIAESKYLSDTNSYRKLIETKNKDGLLKKLTNHNAERVVLFYSKHLYQLTAVGLRLCRQIFLLYHRKGFLA